MHRETHALHQQLSVTLGPPRRGSEPGSRHIPSPTWRRHSQPIRALVAGHVTCVACSWPQLQNGEPGRPQGLVLKGAGPVSWALGWPAPQRSQHSGLLGHTEPPPLHTRVLPGTHTQGRDLFPSLLVLQADITLM